MGDEFGFYLVNLINIGQIDIGEGMDLFYGLQIEQQRFWHIKHYGSKEQINDIVKEVGVSMPTRGKVFRVSFILCLTAFILAILICHVKKVKEEYFTKDGVIDYIKIAEDNSFICILPEDRYHTAEKLYSFDTVKDTVIRGIKGEKLTVYDLKEGQKVRVWVKGGIGWYGKFYDEKRGEERFFDPLGYCGKIQLLADIP